jgi:RING finger protein 113A
MGYDYETDAACSVLRTKPARCKPEEGGSTDQREPNSLLSLAGRLIQTEQAPNPTASMADGGGNGGAGEPGAGSGSAPVCSFVRKPPKNIRKRPAAPAGSDDDDDGGGALAALRSKKGPPSTSKLVFSSADASSEPRRFQYESSRTIQSTDSRATATLETETEFDRDARAIRERQLKQAEAALKKNPSGAASGSGSGAGEVYKGIHGYTDHKAGFRREHTVASEKAGGSHGPLRASAHIRLSARFDYQPDICKDYKETGYCGYGDSCKFMHDRGDYKSGWQLEKEWDEAEKARKRRIAMGGGGSDDEAAEDDDDDDEEALPFACFICRQPFVDPVVTKCKHYFCEHCALKVWISLLCFCLCSMLVMI